VLARLLTHDERHRRLAGAARVDSEGVPADVVGEGSVCAVDVRVGAVFTKALCCTMTGRVR
jgi:hypothetical protein